MAEKPFFVRPLPFDVTTIGNETPGAPAKHLAQFKHSGMIWRSSGNGNLYAEGDFGTTKDVDFCALTATNATSSATIRLRLSPSFAGLTQNPHYDSGPQTIRSPAITRDDGLYHSHLELPQTESRRCWRIDIAGQSGNFEASALVLGKKVTADSFYSAEYGFGAEDLGDIELSRFGVPEEQPGLIYRRLDFTMDWLDLDYFETYFRPLIERLGKREVVYCCFDPEATVYRQSRTYMGWLREDPFATVGGIKAGKVSLPFSILSMF